MRSAGRGSFASDSVRWSPWWQLSAASSCITSFAAITLPCGDWSKQLDINVTASFAMARAVGQHLRAHGGGSIVNVASNCGKVGYNNMAAYNASETSYGARPERCGTF